MSANIDGEREKEAFMIWSDEDGFQSVRPGRCAIPRQGFSLGDMPVTNRSGSQRERRAGRYDALSDCDGTCDVEAFMIRSDEDDFQPDDLTNLANGP